MPKPEFRDKSVRSFVIRQGRMTAAQKRALEELWPRYGLSLDDGRINPHQCFGRQAPLVLEIGYGMGGSLVEMALAEPDLDFIGIEVHPPGVGSLLQKIGEQGPANLRTFMADATDVLRECIEPESLRRIQIYFPDPWPKKKHHKRRLIQPELLNLLASRLQPGGVLHLATDWKAYADHMLETAKGHQALENQAADGSFTPRPDWRPLTKFELRGTHLGHSVFDLLYKKRSAAL